MIHEYDAVIVGAGIAGLTAALEAAENCRVAVITKVHASRSHSGSAQGGISAALGNEEEDHWEWHMFDTIKGGDYLADQNMVEILVREAPQRIIELEHMGVPFSRNCEGKIEQRRFGGHTRNFGEAPIKRACYASDRTGRVIMDTLYDHCLARNVKIYNEVFVTSLLQCSGKCCGVAGFKLSTGDVVIFHAKAVLLATGGCGRIFRTTSMSYAATGDGYTLALDAGIPLMDMEFVQFHPTGIFGLGILLSEAARAEGGVLRNGKGEDFMKNYAPTIRDLAPRDIISRAILTEIAEGRGVNNSGYVYLDLSHLKKQILEEKLSEITSFVKTYLGIDPSKSPIPVAPTCHYAMGGIPTDSVGHVMVDGKTEVMSGLFAVGECACLSIHGANRLGTNSLIDLVVFGKRGGISLTNYVSENEHASLPPEAESSNAKEIETLLKSAGKERISGIREELQTIMTRHCSVFREKKNLKKTLDTIRTLRIRYADIGLGYTEKGFNYNLEEALELGNMLKTAEVIVYSALKRQESRGAHYRNDFPRRDDQKWLKHTLVVKKGTRLKIDYKNVVITKFLPKKRMY